jgi:alpha-tubulin suppressor-like RCC1 family protein
MQATAVACGGHHTTALLVEQVSAVQPETRHALFTFGRNFHGQLGSTNFCDSKAPTTVSLGFRPCQVLISPKTFCMCYLIVQLHQFSFQKSRTRVLCKIWLDELQLPSQDNADLEEETMPAVVANGTHHSTCISRRGELFAWGLGTHGELGLGRWSALEVSSPRQCPLAQIRIVSVACGARHTLAIGESGSLWSCGKNSSGQLGTGNQLDNHRLQLVHNLQ